MPDRYCYVCRRRDGDLIVDEDEGEHRHPDCSLTSVANRLPVTIDDLRVGLHTAEECLLSPASWADPYREAFTCLRPTAMLALEDLQKMEIPPAKLPTTIDEVLAEMCALGHVEISIERYPWRSGDRPWTCQSQLDDGFRGKDEPLDQFTSRIQRGESRGETALEAAGNRLDFIRAGLGIAVLVGLFVPDEVDVAVDAEIRKAIAELTDLIPPPDSTPYSAGGEHCPKCGFRHDGDCLTPNPPKTIEPDSIEKGA